MCVYFFFFFQAEDGIRDYKVTGVQTCALPISVVRVVVVSLVGCGGLLEHDVRDPRVVAHDEGDVVLVTLRVGELHHEHAAGPARRHRERVARRPIALDQSGDSVDRTGGLRHTLQRGDALHQPPTQALVPAHAIHVHRVLLGGSDSDIEGDRLALVHAGGGGVTLDLLAGVVRGRDAAQPHLPVARTRLLVLEHDRRHKGKGHAVVGAGGGGVGGAGGILCPPGRVGGGYRARKGQVEKRTGWGRGGVLGVAIVYQKNNE